MEAPYPLDHAGVDALPPFARLPLMRPTTRIAPLYSTRASTSEDPAEPYPRSADPIHHGMILSQWDFHALWLAGAKGGGLAWQDGVTLWPLGELETLLKVTKK